MKHPIQRKLLGYMSDIVLPNNNFIICERLGWQLSASYISRMDAKVSTCVLSAAASVIIDFIVRYWIWIL